MTNANDKRVKMALERTRMALKAESADLERRRREYGRERELAVAALRILTGLHGDDSWTDETPLAVILEQHLAAPLARRQAEQRARIAELEALLMQRQLEGASRPSARPPAPRPLRPSVVPATEHRPMVVPFQLRGERGFRATCTCGWRSALWNTTDGANQAGFNHATQEERQPLRAVER